MNILILGYGKMGKIISQMAEERGHRIVAKINIENVADLDHLNTDDIDVAIEFSQPSSAVGNITWCMQHNVPVVVGTTGWMEEKEAMTALCTQKNGALFYASNFSIGVNIFKVNAFLAKLMNEQTAYQADLEEIHHTEKKDAPSGTAITLAEGLINNNNRYSKWKLKEGEEKLKKGCYPSLLKELTRHPVHISYPILLTLMILPSNIQHIIEKALL